MKHFVDENITIFWLTALIVLWIPEQRVKFPFPGLVEVYLDLSENGC